MKAKLKIISSMLIFGSIGVFVKNIGIASADLAFLRAVIGCIFLIVVSLLIRQKPTMYSIRANCKLLILSGAAIGLNWIFLFQAYKYTSVSNATLSYYFAPVFVVVASPIVLKERLTFIKSIYIAISMIGLFLILNVSGQNYNSEYSHIKGIAFGLSAAVLYAGVILMNKFIKNLSGFETTLIQLSAAAIVLLPMVLPNVINKLAVLDYKIWLLIILMGVVHTGIAYFIYFSSIKEMKSQSVAIASYIDPISAMFFASVFLNENLSFPQILGGVLILGSTYLSER